MILGTARLLAERFDAKVLFASATLPAFLQREIAEVIPSTVIGLDGRQAADREVLERKRHRIEVREGSLKEQLPEIEAAARSGLKVLVVCNHVRTARELWEFLAPRFGAGAVLLFHGPFNMEDRNNRERRLASETLPSILVATQVVEVSLDISFDIGFFEPAPIDATAQRMGRVNRAGFSPKPVIIAREQIHRHALYSGEAVSATIGELSAIEGPLTEGELVQICDRAYGEGYTGRARLDFERGRDHDFFQRFEETFIAGQHKNWVEEVIDSTANRVEVLAVNLHAQYRELMKNRQWLRADALLVSIWVKPNDPRIERSKDPNEPWIIHAGYDPERGLLT